MLLKKAPVGQILCLFHLVFVACSTLFVCLFYILLSDNFKVMKNGSKLITYMYYLLF